MTAATALEPVFQMTLTGKQWLDMLEPIEEMMEEIDMHGTAEGLILRGMEPTHIVMVNVESEPGAVAGYLCRAPVRFRLKPAVLINAIKRLDDKDSTVTVTIDAMEDVLFLTAVDKGGKKHNYKLKVFAEHKPMEKPSQLPKLRFDNVVQLNLETMHNIIKDLQAVGGDDGMPVRFEMVNGNLTLRSKSDNVEGIITVERASEYATGIEIITAGEGHAAYNIDFIKKLVASINFFKKVQFAWSKDMPIKITFPNTAGLKIEHFIAPRVKQ